MLKKIPAKIFLCVYFLVITEISHQVSKHTENEIILSLISHLKVPRCTFLSEIQEALENVKISKQLSNGKIFAASVSFTEFDKINKADIKVMIIVKIKNMAQLTNFLKVSDPLVSFLYDI